MATAESLAPADAVVSNLKADRRNDASPHPAPTSAAQSKRDKKRQQLMDKIQAVDDRLNNRDRDRNYREQLQRIQLDINLIIGLDPYSDRPLDAIEEQRAQAVPPLPDVDSSGRSGPRSLLEMAGPTFQQFASLIEDFVEERDFELTRQKYTVEKKEQEYRSTHAWATQVAKREHEALSSTLRDRLINIVTAKKVRLAKEKEALEISDSSALYLHPNQFSITNPASPGGTHSKRTTRHRREAEEPLGFSAADSKKRKRLAADDDNNGSPGPRANKGLDTSNATALWHGERLRYRKTAGPVYSIDKLFADKELTMNYNAAALASHKLMVRNKNMNGPNASLSDTELGELDDTQDPDNDANAVSTSMERQPSHATRSTRGANGGNGNSHGHGGGGGSSSGNNHNQHFYDDKLVGLEAFGSFDQTPSLLARMEETVDPRLPPLYPPPYAKHSKDTNAPPPMSADDANADLMAMNLLAQYDSTHGRPGANLDIVNGSRKLLETAAFPARDQRYVTYMQGSRPQLEEARQNLKLPQPSTGKAGTSGNETSHASANETEMNEVGGAVSTSGAGAGAGAGAMAGAAASMSRQNSSGGVAMSRQGTGSSTRGGNRRRA